MHHVTIIGAHETGGEHPAQLRHQRLELVVAGAEVGAHCRPVEGRVAQLRYGVPYHPAYQRITRQPHQLGVLPGAAIEIGAAPLEVEAQQQLADAIENRLRGAASCRRLRH